MPITRRLVTVGLLTVVAVAAQAQGTIKIGEVNSYKAQPAFLEPYKKGMELAVAQINAAGGVNGKKLELITRDETPIRATPCAWPRSCCRARRSTCSPAPSCRTSAWR